MKNLIVKFDLDNLSWNVTEIEQQSPVIHTAYLTIEHNSINRSYQNIKYGVNIFVEGNNIQHDIFEEAVDISIPTKLEIKKTIPLLLQPEKIHDITFLIEVDSDRYNYSYISSTVTPKDPSEPILAPDYELN